MTDPHHIGHNHFSSNPTTSSTPNVNKYTQPAPARRLAARQTLRLAIPKPQPQCGTSSFTDSNGYQNSCNQPAFASTAYRHSPSKLPQPPPPSILKRNNLPPPQLMTMTPPKSASPLESHNLPDVKSTTPLSSASSTGSLSSFLHPYSGSSAGGSSHSSCSSHNSFATATPTGGAKFLGVHNAKPNVSLHSSDLARNNELFVFSKDLPTASDKREHSPRFAEIATNSPTVSTASPTHHLNRLFSMSPSTSLRSNMSDFSDSSHSGVVSPASTLIENFHKKNAGTTVSSSMAPASSLPTTSLINGNSSTSASGLACNGLTSHSNATSLGRQINTSSSSSSSVKESTSTSQQA